MTNNDYIYYVDRSGAELDKKCGQALWWNRHEGGRGIVSAKENLHLKVGGETHSDLRVLAEIEDISPTGLGDLIEPLLEEGRARDSVEQIALELLYRRIGWLVAFGLYIEPKIRREFKNVYIEDEIILERNPLWVGVTPDRVLEHRETGIKVYREWKTTITAKSQWLRSWLYKPQIHLGIAAAQEALGAEVHYGQVMGLLKGDVRSGILSHPLIYAWRRGNEWVFNYDQARSAGWDHAPVWEYPNGPVEFIQRVGEEKCESIFPHTEPIFYKPEIVDDFCRQQLARAKEIQEIKEAWLEGLALDEHPLVFRKNTDNCQPPFGDPCPYLAACWNASVNKSPCTSGLYVPRTPHHEIENLVRVQNGEV